MNVNMQEITSIIGALTETILSAGAALRKYNATMTQAQAAGRDVTVAELRAARTESDQITRDAVSALRRKAAGGDAAAEEL